MDGLLRIVLTMASVYAQLDSARDTRRGKFEHGAQTRRGSNHAVHTVHQDRGSCFIASNATRELHAHWRHALQLDHIAWIGCTDIHREIELDHGNLADIAVATIANARDGAFLDDLIRRLVVLWGEHRFDGVLDAADFEAEAGCHQGDRFTHADMSELA